MIQLYDKVKVLEPIDGKKSVQFEKGKVIYVGRRALVEFDSNVLGHDGNGIGKKGKCWMVDESKLRKEQ